jgi:hypothetical protein
MGNGRKLKRSYAQLALALVVVGLIFAGDRQWRWAMRSRVSRIRRAGTFPVGKKSRPAQ